MSFSTITPNPTTMKTIPSTVTKWALACAIAFASMTTATLLTSCDEKPRSLGEKFDDALDRRPHEKAKDAVEDVKDAVKDAKKAVKDETR